MFLEWNTAKSKFFEVLAERVCYHFLFVPFVFYLGRGIQRGVIFFIALRCGEEGLTLETLAFLLFTVANLHFQLSC